MAGLAPLNALRAFEAAARQGGFVGAAEELGELGVGGVGGQQGVGLGHVGGGHRAAR